MGTSHRHKAGPIGSPNWGKSSAAVSSIANTEKADEQLQQDPSIGIPQEAVDRKRVVYAKRINTQYHNAVRYLVRAAGGRASVSSGRSRAVGRAGVVWATGLAHAFHEIAEQGLVTWLNRKGYNFGVPHDCRETLNIIEGFVAEYFVGMDGTAASEALEHVMDKVEQLAEGQSEKLDEILQKIISEDEIKDMIDDFFGIYIYSHLSQNFKEKLEKDKGVEIAAKTMDEIKELILDDVHRGISGRPASRVDWRGIEGEQFIKDEFNRIILILTNNED